MNLMVKALGTAALLSLISNAALARDYVYGTIAACASYQKPDHSWSPNYRVNVAILDGYHANRDLRANFNQDALVLVIDWRRGRPTLIDLEQRAGINNVPIVLRDTEGTQWRISRTWRHCSNMM